MDLSSAVALNVNLFVYLGLFSFFLYFIFCLYLNAIFFSLNNKVLQRSRDKFGGIRAHETPVQVLGDIGHFPRDFFLV